MPAVADHELTLDVKGLGTDALDGFGIKVEIRLQLLDVLRKPGSAAVVDLDREALAHKTLGVLEVLKRHTRGVGCTLYRSAEDLLRLRWRQELLGVELRLLLRLRLRRSHRAEKQNDSEDTRCFHE